ncbi:MAG: hypothetical protein IKO32_08100 [Lachnospiraceae bacterium]|nr:hypothetical protein [Lachnospiraceae bacterium]
MARMTKEGLEAKIKKAEERVIRTGENYNKAGFLPIINAPNGSILKKGHKKKTF